MNPRKLDRRTLEELETFLRHELVRLQGSLRITSEENRTAEKPGLADIGAHAAATLDAEIQVALVDRRTQQVNQVEGALQRLSDGQYGFCQECDGFVGVARLRALPFAQRCRDCQSRAEQRTGRESPAPARGVPPELEAA